ncbi:MAG: ATP-dependent 6-phosphofructokinase [Desulfovibrionaceae bacterium]|jgi:6-phosphofructokinase 1
MSQTRKRHFEPLHCDQTRIDVLGEAKVDNPLNFDFYVDESDSVFVEVYKEYRMCITDGEGGEEPAMFEHAGPREKIYFDSAKTRCAIVTCGGLCPGLNDVIRAIVMECIHNYHVPAVYGIRYGLAGFIPSCGYDYMELTGDNVANIHEFGGTMLGSSRGPQEPGDIVDALERMNVSILFMIGGDGTMRAASKVQQEIANRGDRIAVIGIPKTIDNDISFVARSFGFDTAVEKAAEAIRCAHTEATGAPNGIGMVKVMGRNAGFIAAEATLASRDVNFVLVPEQPFDLHGEKGFLAALRARLDRRGHAVIVLAEGAGQELFADISGSDASGNVRLGDIGARLSQEINTAFKAEGFPVTLKYIDPSYIIRSVPANTTDSIYCGFLGSHAVHAAMSGRTGMVVSMWNGRYVHIPMGLVTRGKKSINTTSNYWRAVLESTGQPWSMRNA